jgi:phospholipase C
VSYTASAAPRAPYLPTIFDRLDAQTSTSTSTWKIYGGDAVPRATAGWEWAICPTFAGCLYNPAQFKNLVPEPTIVTDTMSGNLPAFSVVTPNSQNSEHNGDSMSLGDNYVGSIVSAIQQSSAWSSTAIFITWDDCGCFSDHVNPFAYDPTWEWGIRVPMIIVSPYARAGYTDSTPTTFAGILKFAENTFNLPKLNSNDGNAYGYRNAFCFPGDTGCVAAGLAPVRMTAQPVAPLTPTQAATQTAEADDVT